jgi:hypothetical protein
VLVTASADPGNSQYKYKLNFASGDDRDQLQKFKPYDVLLVDEGSVLADDVIRSELIDLFCTFPVTSVTPWSIACYHPRLFYSLMYRQMVDWKFDCDPYMRIWNAFQVSVYSITQAMRNLLPELREHNRDGKLIAQHSIRKYCLCDADSLSSNSTILTASADRLDPDRLREEIDLVRGLGPFYKCEEIKSESGNAVEAVHVSWVEVDKRDCSDDDFMEHCCSFYETAAPSLVDSDWLALTRKMVDDLDLPKKFESYDALKRDFAEAEFKIEVSNLRLYYQTLKPGRV